MSEDRIPVVARVVIAVAGLGYVVVFLASLLGGAEAELALLKGMASMLCLGLLGAVAYAFVGSAGEAKGTEATRKLDVALAASPDELAGSLFGRGAGDSGEGK